MTSWTVIISQDAATRGLLSGKKRAGGRAWNQFRPLFLDVDVVSQVGACTHADVCSRAREPKRMGTHWYMLTQAPAALSA